MNGRPYTERELATVRKLYSDTSTSVIAQKLGRPLPVIYRIAKTLGLRKSEEYRAKVQAEINANLVEVGKAHRYHKGNVPPNTGTRRPGYAPGRMAEHQFKKGESTNKMALGSTRLIDGYVYRKVSEIPNVPHTRNWRLEHHLVWEKAGRKPIKFRTHSLIFKDGNRLNTALENLKRITRKKNMLRNSIHTQYPKPLVDLIMLNGALKRQLKKKGTYGEKPADGRTQPSL